MDDRDQALDHELPDRVRLKALAQAPFGIILTNHAGGDDPIVYVNPAFEKITGYAKADVTGRNCRFLQGDETDPRTVATLREAVHKRHEITVDILNYRADGTEFWNRLTISPLEAEGEDESYYFGFMTLLDQRSGDGEEIDAVLREIQHRVKNHLAMVVGMIRLQGASGGSEHEFTTLARRVESLQLLYEELGDRRGDEAEIALGAYVNRVVNTIAHLDGRPGLRVNVDADQISASMETAMRVGLVVSEVLTNALQHAFEGRDSGAVEARVERRDDCGVRVSIADDGVGIPEGKEWPKTGSLGGRIVREFVSGLGGELTVETGASGTTVIMDAPGAALGPGSG